jgi:hypothetical protein
MHSDLIELLWLLVKGNVKFLIIGGIAVSEYADPRFTKDVDIVVGLDLENARKLVKILKDFGAPTAGLLPEFFTEEEHFFILGGIPNRIDILSSIPGISFEDAWERRESMSFGRFEAPLISLDDLIEAKLAAGRPQDLADVRNLLEVRRYRNSQKKPD